MHVDLLQQVDGESVDLREEAHQEGHWEAVGEPCPMGKHKQKPHKLLLSLSKKEVRKSACVFGPTHEHVPQEVQRVVADDGDSVQGGDGQIFPPQQQLQQPDQSAEDAEVGRSTVGHQLVVTLRTHLLRCPHNSLF